MKFEVTAKVIDKQEEQLKRPDGTPYSLFSLIVEEMSQYPSRFRLSTKDASLLKSVNPGEIVEATGFVNGRFKTVLLAGGRSFTKYDAYFTLRSLSVKDAPAPAAKEADGEFADVPF